MNGFQGDAIELDEPEALPVLTGGEIIALQQIPWGSNYTFVAQIDAGNGRYIKAIYKPCEGEQPLHDFPAGTLYKREYAAFLLARALGWPEVPLTVVRDGPYGVGSVQLYVEADTQLTYFDVSEKYRDEFLKFSIFDVISNNADRKGGHCLIGEDGRIWSIDHGLTFHHVFKMRSVMLEFWGQPVPQPLIAEMQALADRLARPSGLVEALRENLSQQEIDAISMRLERLLKMKAIPMLDPNRNVPWPLV